MPKPLHKTACSLRRCASLPAVQVFPLCCNVKGAARAVLRCAFRWPFEFQGGAAGADWEAWASGAIRSLHQMLSQSMSREATVFMVPGMQVG